MKHASMNERT